MQQQRQTAILAWTAAQCDKLGIDREEVAEAAKVGLMVNHGAESAIRKKARELFGDSVLGH